MLKEHLQNIPFVLHTEPEIQDAYGSLLDDLNTKYERLMSLLRETIENSPDTNAFDRTVSRNILIYYLIFPLCDVCWLL